MKKILLLLALPILVAGVMFMDSFNNDACAGSKCYYEMICPGNSNIKAIVCTEDCNDSKTKEKVKEWFKKKCSSASTPSYPKWGWEKCDVKL